jgi:hypothetical protein
MVITYTPLSTSVSRDMKKQVLYILLLLFLLADLGYSFAQHLSQPLDGDMAWNIVPSEDVKPILADPLGAGVLLKNKSYPNPNRFFCHYAMKKYFDNIPLLLQTVVSPIESIYLSCAIAKILIQLAIIIMLAMVITGKWSLFTYDFLIAAVLVTPFFQSEGYQSYMGIIDKATTYAFFYALPSALLMIYFLPFIQQYHHDKKPSGQTLIYLLWIPFAAIICLSGPLNPGVVLIFSLLVFLSRVRKNFLQSEQKGIFTRLRFSIFKIPGNYWFYLLPVCILSLYSLYIGRSNSNNINIPLIELYSRLPAGIYNPLTKKLGFPVLLLSLAVNYFIIRKNYKTEEAKKILTLFKWIGAFALLYILLLPLGGYRENRLNVLRYDTYMPITLCLIFLFGASVLFLFKSLNAGQNKFYIPVITGVLLLFTLNDEPHFDKNKGERNALQEISVSKSSIVRLPGNCPVSSWEKTTNPEDSRLNGQMFMKWRVTKTVILFYNE